MSSLLSSRALAFLAAAFITGVAVGSLNGSFSPRVLAFLALAIFGVVLLLFIQVKKTPRNNVSAQDLTTETFRRLFQVSTDMICTANAEGCFVDLSPSWEEVLGYSIKELKTRPFIELVHPDDRNATIQEVERLLTSDHPCLLFENRYRAKSGDYHWLQWCARTDDERDIIFCIARDITKVKETEAELLRANQAAQGASIAKSQFLANMSHEIRTPMNGIVGMTDVLFETQLSEEQRDYLNVIRSSALSLREIIDDILDFSKIEAGRLDFESVGFDLVDLLESATTMFRELAVNRQLGFRLERKDLSLSHVDGDPHRLRQVINNLVGNALKFTPNGEIRLRAHTIKESPETARVCFEVKDTGIGIPKEKIERIFEPFTQADGSTTRNFGGTGLGLSICRQIVNLMGGQIGVTSQVGQGTTFWFWLPLKRSTSVPAIESTIQATNHTSGYNVLVAEDSHINQKVVVAMLKSMGHSATVVDDGQAAVDTLRERAFDVILMDCQMPKLDGFQATAAIRKLPVRSSTPIIALTGQALRKDREKCLNAGMDGYLAKPITKKDLAQTMNDLLTARQADKKEEIKYPQAVNS